MKLTKIFGDNNNRRGYSRSLRASVNGDEGYQSESGKAIKADDVLKIGPISRAINIISKNIAQLKVENELINSPNRRQSKTDFIKHVITNLMIYGNTFILIYSEGGRKSLKVLNSGDVKVQVNQAGYLIYNVYEKDTKSDNGERVLKKTYSSNEICHIKDVSFPGDYEGYSRIGLNGSSLSDFLNVQQYINFRFKSSQNISGVISSDEELDEETQDALLESIKSFQGKATRSGGTIVLDKGLTYTTVGPTTYADADLRQLRQDFIHECASIFEIPPNMLGANASTRYSNQSQTMRSLFRDSLYPIIMNVQEALSNHKEIGETVFNVNEFIRGDLLNQVAIADKAFRAGLLSVNEGREIMGKERVEDTIQESIYDEIPVPQGKSEEQNSEDRSPNNILDGEDVPNQEPTEENNDE